MVFFRWKSRVTTYYNENNEVVKEVNEEKITVGTAYGSVGATGSHFETWVARKKSVEASNDKDSNSDVSSQ